MSVLASDAYRARLLMERRPVRLRYSPLRPTGPQLAFLWLDAFEAFYGGAAGPGKSTALLMAALQYVDVPGYSALLVRRTFAELSMEGALMEMAHDWLDDSDAHWNAGERRWEFPAGAKLQFGHLEYEDSKRRYQSASFQFIGFDELTHFTETQWTYLFSRCRRPASDMSYLGASRDGMTLDQVPLRMRAASNPGGSGHEWVKRRYIDTETREQESITIRARLEDNRYIDRESYMKALSLIPGAERDRLLRGDWAAADSGTMFKVDALVFTATVKPYIASVRWWDLAASEPGPQNMDPDWTVGLRMRSHGDGTYTLDDVLRFRRSSKTTDDAIVAAAARDGKHVPIRFEQEPGAAGKKLVTYMQQLLPGFDVKGIPSSGDKEVRARPVASAVENQVVSFLSGLPWEPCIEEMKRFPGGSHDDFVDSLSGAHSILSSAGPVSSDVPQGRLPDRSWQTGR